MIDRLAALLRGERGAAASLAAAPVVHVLDAAERHGVLPLVADALERTPAASAAALRRALHDATTRHAAADLVREHALRDVIASFHDAGIAFLLIKGAHLAYAVYPRPDLRPRLDTDLLIRPQDRQAAAAVLARIGYVAEAQAGGDLVNYQATYLLTHGAGVAHVVDLHWRLANPQAFGGVLDITDLGADAVLVARLAPARAPGPVHACLVACVHRVAHHPDDDRLIWLYDVDLLARGFDDGAWERFLAWADDRAVGAVCGRSLSDAVEMLGTPVPAWVRSDARLSSPRARSAPSAAFLEPGRRHVQTVAQDFALLPTWSARWRFVRQHLFPPSSYMRTVYAPSSHMPLPVLYAQRAWRGAWRWLVKS